MNNTTNNFLIGGKMGRTDYVYTLLMLLMWFGTIMDVWTFRDDLLAIYQKNRQPQSAVGF